MRSNALVATVIAATAVIVVPTTAASPNAATARPNQPTAHARSTAATLQRDIRSVRRSGEVVGALARVERGGRVSLARAGSAQLGTHRPVPWNSEFRIASTTKTFVAAVALQLVHEGALSLDDTVERWLPGVVRGHGNDGRLITLRDLLGQRSGLFDYVQDPALQRNIAENIEAYRFDDSPPRRWVAIAMRHRPLFAAGTRWAYSNTNYVLAAMIIQHATGRDWVSQVEHRIIAPLRLRHTYSSGANPFLVGPHAHSYVYVPGRRHPIDLTVNSIGHAGDSGLVSTTADLSRFFRALSDGRLLTPDMQREMRRTTPADDPFFPHGRYGLGLRYEPLSCGGGYWTHEGDHPGGVHTRSAVSADGRRTVVVSTTGALGPRTGRALNRLTDDALCR